MQEDLSELHHLGDLEDQREAGSGLWSPVAMEICFTELKMRRKRPIQLCENTWNGSNKGLEGRKRLSLME